MRLCMLGSGQRFFVDGDPSPPSNDLDMANTTFHCADQSAFTHSRGNPATPPSLCVVDYPLFLVA